MTTRSHQDRAQAGFTLIELLVVVSVIVILTAIAIGQYSGARATRVRTEATSSLPALKAFEEEYYQRTGAFVFSSGTSDRIKYGTATTNQCTGRVGSSAFQSGTLQYAPQGCQYEYFVIAHRCDADCADAGAPDTGANLTCASSPSRCFCAVAIGTGTVAKNDRFCTDDLGRTFSNVAEVKGWN